MKKIIYIFTIVLLFTACNTTRLDLRKLTTGMNKEQVRNIAGAPYRILAVNETSDGYQEVLEYRTNNGDIYALEFWNDYLTGYEYLYDDVQYVPTPYPAYFPPYGRPIYLVQTNRPGSRPNYNYQNRPSTNNRPSQTVRPSNPSNQITQPTRPSTDRSSSGSGTRTPSSNSGSSTNRTNRTQ